MKKSDLTFSFVHQEQPEVFGPGCRNDTSHPHETVTWGSHVWVVDLGTEISYQIHIIYQYNKMIYYIM